MPESNALSFARLVDWLEGRLSEEKARAVEEQVAVADEPTRANIAWLRAFLQVSKTTVLASPPSELRALLRRRFEAYAQDRRQPGFLQCLVATLSFDSRMQPAVAGVRATGARESQQQLVYTTDVADVALNIQPRSDNRFDLDGQIFPAGDVAPDAFSIQLLRQADELGLTTADDLGEFAFEAVSPGVYELIVSTDQFEVLIAAVELQEE